MAICLLLIPACFGDEEKPKPGSEGTTTTKSHLEIFNLFFSNIYFEWTHFYSFDLRSATILCADNVINFSYAAVLATKKLVQKFLGALVLRDFEERFGSGYFYDLPIRH